MPRVVKEEDYAVRRNEILDAARVLIYTRGYEQMSVQEVVDALHISKGAFYHYFDSKPALLEALVNRMEEEASQFLLPIVNDPRKNALEKLNLFFAAAAQWKTAQKEYMLAILRIWYSDDNAIVRQKLIVAGIEWVTPMLEPILQQGVAEGALAPPFPAQAAQMTMTLLLNLGDSVGRLILAGGAEHLAQARGLVAAYNDAIARILNAPPGSIKVFDEEMLDQWAAVSA